MSERLIIPGDLDFRCPHVFGAEWQHCHICNPKDHPGYHLRDIPKGQFGELSKIKEEVEEAIEADEQGVEIMVLQELSDVLASIDGYLEKYHPSLTLDDLARMAHVTRRAFKNGHRTP